MALRQLLPDEELYNALSPEGKQKRDDSLQVEYVTFYETYVPENQITDSIGVSIIPILFNYVILDGRLTPILCYLVLSRYTG